MGEGERGGDERAAVGNDYVHGRQTGQAEDQRRSSFYLSWKHIATVLAFHMIDCPACRPSFMFFKYRWLLIASYKYDRYKRKNIMANVGIEPKTFALLARRSNQLS
jgi:hypothetical protein